MLIVIMKLRKTADVKTRMQLDRVTKERSERKTKRAGSGAGTRRDAVERSATANFYLSANVRHVLFIMRRGII